MQLGRPIPRPWRLIWRDQARTYPWTTLGLLVAAGGLFWLLLGGIAQITTAGRALAFALAGGAAGLVATSAGALPALALPRVAARAEDGMLGLAAGMMLAAASFSLVLPGLEAARRLTENGVTSALVVAVGLGMGALLMLGLDRFTPHEHLYLGVHGAGGERLSRVRLFVLAVALHNLPEGMAIGVAFGESDLATGLPVAAAIALQDIPEGLAVAMALKAASLAPTRAVAIAAATGLLEPLGALLGVTLSSGLALAYPIGLGLAAGAMIFVVSHEVIPETHRNGHQTIASLGLITGFAVMMFLDTALS